MLAVARVPRDLQLLPFRGSAAIAAGLLTPAQLRGRAWRRLFPDVYVAADVDLDHRLYCEAAMIYATGCATADSLVAVSGLSAAHVLGVDQLVDTASVEVTAGHAMRLRSVGLAVVRSRLLRTDLAPIGPFPVTGPERTAFDLARRLPRLDAVAAVDALLHRRLTTVEAIRAFAIGRPSLRGRPRVFAILSLANALAESPMESVLRVTLTDGGLPMPECQVTVIDPDGRFIGRLDMAYRQAMVGIEYEGDHHRERTAFRNDLARINAMQAAGWIIVRATAADIRQPARLIDQIRIALARSGR